MHITLATGIPTTHEKNFTFLTPSLSRIIRPTRGPEKGGTSVIIVGEHMSRRGGELGYLRCRFNVTVVAASYVNQSAMRCSSPPLAASVVSTGTAARVGRVSLEVSSNAVDFSSGGAHFEYIEPVRVARVFPSLGAATGGELVQVEGWGFLAVSDLRCSFGGVQTIATFI